LILCWERILFDRQCCVVAFSAIPLNHFHLSGLRKQLKVRWQDRIPHGSPVPSKCTQNLDYSAQDTNEMGRLRTRDAKRPHPKATFLWRTCPWQAFCRWPEKVLQRHLESLNKGLSTLGKLWQRSAPRGAISSPHGLIQPKNEGHWPHSNNGNNARFLPPLSSSFNHPTGVHLVAEASQCGLASLVISETVRAEENLNQIRWSSWIRKVEEESTVTEHC